MEAQVVGAPAASHVPRSRSPGIRYHASAGSMADEVQLCRRNEEVSMAKRKAMKKRAKRVVKKSTRKLAKKGARKAASKRSTTRRPQRAARSRRAAAPSVRLGVITHTELASADPQATQVWCERVLGWKFGDAVSTPTGPYHMWRFENGTGGGIRGNNPPEMPGSIPYCEVADIRATYSKALAA